MLVLGALATACASLPIGGDRSAFETFSAPPASESAGYCAWYGDPQDHLLYFGESAFWASTRAAKGDAMADAAVDGPKRIGRFDLFRQAMEAPLTVDVPGGSGVWDVLALPGRVYFTTFFGPAGYVDTQDERVTVMDDLGVGLNELAPGPGQTLLASRYGAADGGQGSVVLFSASGSLVAEYPLSAPEGLVAAPKTVAFDPVRREIWATVDLVSRTGGPSRQDVRRLAADGRLLARIEDPEIQFVVFTPDGTGYFAARYGRALSLLVLEKLAMSGDPLAMARRIALDDAFDREFDFVQDIHRAADGRVVLTRWSGRVHVVDPITEESVTVDLPRDAGNGLYYSGVLLGDRLCATYCAGVQVVCTQIPAAVRPTGRLW